MASPFNTFGAELRASYNQYKAYCNVRTLRSQRVIDLFFAEMIRPNVKNVLLKNAKEGRSWGYVYTYPKDLYVVLNQGFGKQSKPVLTYSDHWVKDSYQIYELIHHNHHFVKLMAQVEEELSDAYTVVRIHRTESIDNEEKFNGVWVEWYNTTSF
uniref:Uncharacterized protein n=1 Tax=viral metagenome TaxID=1070528 RepID=A0A6C0CU36_9ZZZZ